jgi:hypothetical protein
MYYRGGKHDSRHGKWVVDLDSRCVRYLVHTFGMMSEIQGVETVYEDIQVISKQE